jgi:hypothetical protein
MMDSRALGPETINARRFCAVGRACETKRRPATPARAISRMFSRISANPYKAAALRYDIRCGSVMRAFKKSKR